ncbi:MAG: hypothetical protein HY361_04465 [Candidatus Aenigmarchaeota archaeon]|nr:hypothetical protein [Candidatus Aenigmarchaeota archaeon]
MTKKGIDKVILNLIKDAGRPLSTRDIALKLNLAWHTADRYCLKLQLQGKVANFTIGKSTAWYKK